MATATHLGHELHESGTMEHDASVKRAEFIGKSTDIRETFAFASPMKVIRAVKVFAGDLYVWREPLETERRHGQPGIQCLDYLHQAHLASTQEHHIYFVDRGLSSGICHIRNDILARYVTFLTALRRSPSKEVSVLVNIEVTTNLIVTAQLNLNMNWSLT